MSAHTPKRHSACLSLSPYILFTRHLASHFKLRRRLMPWRLPPGACHTSLWRLKYCLHPARCRCYLPNCLSPVLFGLSYNVLREVKEPLSSGRESLAKGIWRRFRAVSLSALCALSCRARGPAFGTSGPVKVMLVSVASAPLNADTFHGSCD